MSSISTELPAISVAIPAYNEEELIARVIGSVRESFSAIGFHAYEIVVCDNNSTDRTAAIAQSQGARVVFEPHNQISRARNAAAAQARGRWMIFLDGDTFMNAPLLSETVKCMESGKVAGGGAVLEFDSTNLAWFPSRLTWLWKQVSTRLHLAAGSYLFCLRDAWEQVGGFDERVYAGEELYFSRRVKRWGRQRGLGFRVLTDTPVVTSARKMEWYNQAQLLRHVLLLSFPGALKRREACGLWYSRPGAGAKDGAR